MLDNAALPLELMGVARETRYVTARTALQQVSLYEAEDRYPAQLSGGMRMPRLTGARASQRAASAPARRAVRRAG